MIKSCFLLGCDVEKNKKKYNGILGISVGSRSFSKNKIEDYIKFCTLHFDKTLILIVDSIKKYNLMSVYGISETDALKKSLHEGDEMLIAVKRVIKKLKYDKIDTSNLKLIKWSDAIKEIKDYDKTIKILKKFYSEDIDFNKDVKLMSESYIKSRNINTISKEKIETATNFLIEELAFFLLIGISTKDEYCIDVYPGKFPVILFI